MIVKEFKIMQEQTYGFILFYFLLSYSSRINKNYMQARLSITRRYHLRYCIKLRRGYMIVLPTILIFFSLSYVSLKPCMIKRYKGLKRSSRYLVS